MTMTAMLVKNNNLYFCWLVCYSAGDISGYIIWALHCWCLYCWLLVFVFVLDCWCSGIVGAFAVFCCIIWACIVGVLLGVCNCNIALLVLWCSGERGSIGGSRGRYLDGDAGALIIGHWWLLLVLLLVFELLVLCLVLTIVTVLWCSGERGRIGGSGGSQWQPLTDNSIALPVLVLPVF